MTRPRRRSKPAAARASDASLIYQGHISAKGYNNNVGQTKADYRRFTTRHHGGGNLLFADGHVAWFGWLEVQVPSTSLPYNPNRSDANQPGFCVWSCLGPVN